MYRMGINLVLLKLKISFGVCLIFQILDVNSLVECMKKNENTSPLGHTPGSKIVRAKENVKLSQGRSTQSKKDGKDQESLLSSTTQRQLYCVAYNKETYLQSGDSRTRGGHKFYQERTTSEVYNAYKCLQILF